jgi:hypothetical protein
MSKPFNSNYGIDLGELSEIQIQGITSNTDQVLILKPDGTGKFYLQPQSIANSANSGIIYGSTGNSYLHKEVFTYNMNPTSSYVNIATFTIDPGVKNKIYLTAKVDLIGQATATQTYDYYHFTTGYNIVSDVNGDNSEYYYRHIPSHFSYLYSKTTNDATCKAVGSDKQFQNFSTIPSNNTLILQPKFSTITNPLVTNSYPRIISSIDTNDKLLLTFQAKSIKLTTEKIDWFGSIEFFVSIV